MGDKVQARDIPDVHWYKPTTARTGTVTEKLQRGGRLSIKIHFAGFPNSHDDEAHSIMETTLALNTSRNSLEE